MAEGKVNYRFMGEHSQGQGLAGQLQSGCDQAELGHVREGGRRRERKEMATQQPGGQGYKRVGNQNVWIMQAEPLGEGQPSSWA